MHGYSCIINQKICAEIWHCTNSSHLPKFATCQLQRFLMLDPRDCRKYVEEFFSVEKMTDQYEMLYKKLIQAGDNKNY